MQEPWAVLCVDLIGPSTLKSKDGTQIYFMCLTMIDPATRWFKVVELPVVKYVQTTPEKAQIKVNAQIKQTIQLMNKNTLTKLPVK